MFEIFRSRKYLHDKRGEKKCSATTEADNGGTNLLITNTNNNTNNN
jgi:hypothetical protein